MADPNSHTNGQLSGRRIVITGGAAGIGAGIAGLFAQEGARLTLLDVNAEVLRTARELGAVGLAVDVCSEEQVNAAIDAAAQSMGGIDGLVNVAGILARGRVEDMDVSLFRKVVEVNLVGTFIVCRSALRHLRNSTDATIVNVASIAGLRAARGGTSAYAASKGAVIRFSEALAIEVSPEIRVNCLCPGLIRTPMTEHLFQSDNPSEQENRILLGRAGEPIDVAKAALFLTSGSSAFITAEALVVSGGVR